MTKGSEIVHSEAQNLVAEERTNAHQVLKPKQDGQSGEPNKNTSSAGHCWPKRRKRGKDKSNKGNNNTTDKQRAAETPDAGNTVPDVGEITTLPDKSVLAEILNIKTTKGTDVETSQPDKKKRKRGKMHFHVPTWMRGKKNNHVASSYVQGHLQAKQSSHEPASDNQSGKTEQRQTMNEKLMKTFRVKTNAHNADDETPQENDCTDSPTNQDQGVLQTPKPSEEDVLETESYYQNQDQISFKFIEQIEEDGTDVITIEQKQVESEQVHFETEQQSGCQDKHGNVTPEVKNDNNKSMINRNYQHVLGSIHPSELKARFLHNMKLCQERREYLQMKLALAARDELNESKTEVSDKSEGKRWFGKKTKPLKDTKRTKEKEIETQNSETPVKNKSDADKTLKRSNETGPELRVTAMNEKILSNLPQSYISAKTSYSKRTTTTMKKLVWGVVPEDFLVKDTVAPVIDVVGANRTKLPDLTRADTRRKEVVTSKFYSSFLYALFEQVTSVSWSGLLLMVSLIFWFLSFIKDVLIMVVFRAHSLVTEQFQLRINDDLKVQRTISSLRRDLRVACEIIHRRNPCKELRTTNLEVLVLISKLEEIGKLKTAYGTRESDIYFDNIAADVSQQQDQMNI